MFSEELAGCCAMGVIADLYCLVEHDDWEKEEAKKFDTQDFKGKYAQVGGSNVTAVIVTLSEEEMSPSKLKKQIAFITARDFKLLATWKNKYGKVCYLYGKGFTLPKKETNANPRPRRAARSSPKAPKRLARRHPNK